MKKLILILAVFLLIGCEKDMNNTPTKRVEVFLSNYQSLSEEVQAKIVSDVDEMPNLTEDEKKNYTDLWKKHYQNLTYEVKDEKVDGDNAIVTVEIEVTDYSKIIENANQMLTSNPTEFQDETGTYSPTRFNDYKLEAMKGSSDKVKYTLELNVQKIDKKWVLQDLTEDEYLKLSGMYVY